MIRRNFVRKKEDFVCLWGRHIDGDIPGDRLADCGGAMEPIKAVYEKGRFRIFYKCVECGKGFLVKAGKSDDRKELVRLARN
ncbi:hypothetical protein DRH14_03350 [Candidatus Shapirobacteria bacterium]|nr:MAG: hypothetical protein DRH14_03350 [Candidatus Shapirobacteria bacterium]